MKRRTFLKSLAASVAGLFCANVAAKKSEPEKEYHDDRYWVRGGGITVEEMRAIEEQYEARKSADRARFYKMMMEDGVITRDEIRTIERNLVR